MKIQVFVDIVHDLHHTVSPVLDLGITNAKVVGEFLARDVLMPVNRSRQLATHGPPQSLESLDDLHQRFEARWGDTTVLQVICCLE